MNVLSLFDGKSSGFTACELAGIEVGTYYSAEIDKYAIKVSDAIHPNQMRLGSVTEWRDWDVDWSSIDMIFGGFPCQAWSVAGKQLGDKDERGMLFWTMLDIMKHVRHHNPKADFLIENVKMKKEFEEYITHHMENAVGDVHKVLINSALVSAQNRNRYYWTSFPVTQPEDRGLVLKGILEPSDGIEDCFYYSEKSIAYMERGNDKWMQAGACRADRYTQTSKDSKSFTLTANMHKGVPYNYFMDDNGEYRKKTLRECFRLQTVPERYIDKILSCGVSNSQLYKIAGNGWTDEVIAHILRYMEV
ncbi:C-5 cytosine-specific DNA methylase [Vibrio phage 1.091.O._10N.286.52.B12]|nr:C-5 cytosine-specific DNA methylase [Vibrio phage 1.091.O._10N.286.52.B12]